MMRAVRRALGPLVSLGLVLLAGCGGDDGGDDDGQAVDDAADTTTTTTSTPASSTTTTVPTDAAARVDCREAGAGSSPATFDDGAGQYAVFLTAVSPDDGTLSFDVVQWLSGEDANAAYEAETGDSSGAPNDYYIVNENEQVRTAPIGADADVHLVAVTDGVALEPSTVAALATADLEPFPFWLTFDDGVVVDVCQQYRP